MSRRRALEIRWDDDNPQKWRVSLAEDAFLSFMAQGGEAAQRVFGDGSLFGPLLFQKFFDPADAFPLWEFETDTLLSGHPSARGVIDWSETEEAYVLRAELPVCARDVEIGACGDNNRVMEISGCWRKGSEPIGRDWRNGRWWEYGFVRRLELPEDADWRKMEAFLDNDGILEINIPKAA
ncbi:hypothetical protein HPP92_000867 [Vanilla planifolia]|uniref:SHSP domain-containing protein n=1 Tax=Vanilla planifolia TaxID=51239 RepID=A0A835RQ09_VANPL|nr:hypothetical protein HPP92_000867 [Vanilla planifolia]